MIAFLCSTTVPEEVHNILRLRVCAAYMKGFLSSKLLKKGLGILSLFSPDFPETFLKFGRNSKKRYLKMGNFPPKIIIKVGTKAGFGH